MVEDPFQREDWTQFADLDAINADDPLNFDESPILSDMVDEDEVAPVTARMRFVQHPNSEGKAPMATVLHQERDAFGNHGILGDYQFGDVAFSGQINPLPTDVIFGKGGRLRHPGNQMFRAECLLRAPRFFATPTSTVKRAVANELVCFVLMQGGRFLIEDPHEKGTWKLADIELACKKARQLLADEKKKCSNVASRHARQPRLIASRHPSIISD